MSDDPDDFLDGAIAERRAAHSAPKKRSGPTPAGDNSRDPADAYNITADELRQFIDRAEQLELQKREVAEELKELFAEAKGRGYDTKVMKKVLALRRRKPDEIAEEEAVLSMYLAALGMN